MDGLATLLAAPDIRGGNIAGDVFEQIDTGLVKMRDDLGRRVSFLFFIRTGDQIGWNDESQCFGADTRAIGDDEIAKREQRFVFLPHGDVQESVGANDEKESIPVAVIDVAEVTHSVHGIVELRAAEILTGFG